MTTKEYREYKILFEKCYALKEEDPDLYFGSSYEADIDYDGENENPKKEPEDEVQ